LQRKKRGKAGHMEKGKEKAEIGEGNRAGE
jgi:hypothetical protein